MNDRDFRFWTIVLLTAIFLSTCRISIRIGNLTDINYKLGKITDELDKRKLEKEIEEIESWGK